MWRPPFPGRTKENTEPVAPSSTTPTSFPPGLAASAYDPQVRLQPRSAPCSVRHKPTTRRVELQRPACEIPATSEKIAATRLLTRAERSSSMGRECCEPSGGGTVLPGGNVASTIRAEAPKTNEAPASCEARDSDSRSRLSGSGSRSGSAALRARCRVPLEAPGDSSSLPPRARPRARTRGPRPGPPWWHDRATGRPAPPSAHRRSLA